MTRKNISNDKSEAAQISRQITVREAGCRGGRATLQTQGTEFFRRIGKRGGQRTKELYGELLSEFGRRGGRPRRPPLNKPVVGEGDHQ